MSLLRTITIQTPESVELEFTLAGIGSRALALLVDYTVLTALIMGVIIFSVLLNEQLTQLAVALGGGTDAIELWLGAIFSLVLFTIYVGYFVIFETAWQGQSPGKRFAQIRVVRETGQPAGVFQATLRSLLRPIDDVLFIGFFMIALAPREKRIGDWLAGTLVVQADRFTANANVVTTSAAAAAIAQQLIDLADISQIQPDDFAVIRTYLSRRTSLYKEAKAEVSLQLARQVKAVIGLETLPTDMTPDVFLEAIYLAYQQQTDAPRDRRTEGAG